MDLIDKYLCEKKVTKATVMSVLKKTKAMNFDGLELSGRTIALWYNLDNEKQATKLMKAIVKLIPNTTTTNDGNKYLIYWKGNAPDLTKVNTR